MQYLLTPEEYEALKNANRVTHEKARSDLMKHFEQELPGVLKKLGYGPGPSGFVVQLEDLKRILHDFQPL